MSVSSPSQHLEKGFHPGPQLAQSGPFVVDLEPEERNPCLPEALLEQREIVEMRIAELDGAVDDTRSPARLDEPFQVLESPLEPVHSRARRSQQVSRCHPHHP